MNTNTKKEALGFYRLNKKQLFLAIISANGIKNNFYAEDNISGVVTLDDLFMQESQ